MFSGKNSPNAVQNVHNMLLIRIWVTFSEVPWTLAAIDEFPEQETREDTYKQHQHSDYNLPYRPPVISFYCFLNVSKMWCLLTFSLTGRCLLVDSTGRLLINP
jgi:hypothetical protein